MREIAILGGLLLLFVGAGCHAPAQPTAPSQMLLRVADYEPFLDDVLTLLREHDFQILRVDRDRGTIVTRPTTGGQWFEFWRGDSRGAYNLLESSLHTIRRTVTLLVAARAGGPADEFDVSVEVQKERFSSPERQVTTASGALQIYSERLPTQEGLRAGRVRGDHWVPLGRDDLLERYLLQRVADLANVTRPGTPAETAPSSEDAGPTAIQTTPDSASPAEAPTVQTLPQSNP